MLFTPDLSFLGSATVSASLLLVEFLKGQVELLAPLCICTLEPLSLEVSNLGPREQSYLWSHAIPQMMGLDSRAHKNPRRAGRQYTRICYLWLVDIQPCDVWDVCSQVGSSWWDLCGCFRQGTEELVGVTACGFLEQVRCVRPSTPCTPAPPRGGIEAWQRLLFVQSSARSVKFGLKMG